MSMIMPPSIRRLLWEVEDGHGEAAATGAKRGRDDRDEEAEEAAPENGAGAVDAPAKKVKACRASFGLFSSSDENEDDGSEPPAKRIRAACGRVPREWFKKGWVLSSPIVHCNGRRSRAPPVAGLPLASSAESSSAATTFTSESAAAMATAFSPAFTTAAEPKPASASTSSSLLHVIPPEVLASDILSFLMTSSDRFALQCTCQRFRAISDRTDFMKALDLGGREHEKGRGSDEAPGVDCGGEGINGRGRRGILGDDDTPETATRKLTKFCQSSNLQATHMLGMIRAYCDDSPLCGVALLRRAASLGYARSSYALGLVLRDASPDESCSHLLRAARAGYLPAWQELLSAARAGCLPAWQELLPAEETMARLGDLDADRLSGYLDYPCLNRLLRRHYVGGGGDATRRVQTSHCRNPLCGRWAYRTIGDSDRWLGGARATEERRGEARAWEGAGAGHDLPGDGPAATLFGLLGDLGDGVLGNAAGRARLAGEGRANRGANLGRPVRGAVIGGLAIPGWAAAFDNNAAAVVAHHTAPILPIPRALTRGNGNNNDGGIGNSNSSSTGSGGIGDPQRSLRVSRMMVCSSCQRAKYCSRLCQVFDWRFGRHKIECRFL